MKITVCIGSSCHLKGSRQIVEQFRQMIDENGLADKVEMAGKFCMDKCGEGVCVTVDGEVHSIKPDEAYAFFQQYVIDALK